MWKPDQTYATDVGMYSILIDETFVPYLYATSRLQSPCRTQIFQGVDIHIDTGAECAVGNRTQGGRSEQRDRTGGIGPPISGFSSQFPFRDIHEPEPGYGPPQIPGREPGEAPRTQA